MKHVKSKSQLLRIASQRGLDLADVVDNPGLYGLSLGGSSVRGLRDHDPQERARHISGELDSDGSLAVGMGLDDEDEVGF